MNWKQTFSDLGLLELRILIGLGMSWHGYQKIFGGFIHKLAEGVAGMGFPFSQVFAWLAALSEFAGGILIVLGLGTRFAALSIFISMSVAAFIAHAADPLAVKELALAYWGAAGALLLTGPGSLSLDRIFHKK